MGLSLQGIDSVSLIQAYRSQPHRIRVWIYVGKQDQYGNVEPTQTFVSQLRDMGESPALIMDDGDHYRGVARQLH